MQTNRQFFEKYPQLSAMIDDAFLAIWVPETLSYFLTKAAEECFAGVAIHSLSHVLSNTFRKARGWLL